MKEYNNIILYNIKIKEMLQKGLKFVKNRIDE